MSTVELFSNLEHNDFLPRKDNTVNKRLGVSRLLSVIFNPPTPTSSPVLSGFAVIAERLRRRYVTFQSVRHHILLRTPTYIKVIAGLAAP